MRKILLCMASPAHHACGAWAGSSGIASVYPSKHVRWIVGFPPGGSDDFISRTIGGKITERFGQTVIVDNRPGAAGNLATEIAARANPDGHTTALIGGVTASSTSRFVPSSVTTG